MTKLKNLCLIIVFTTFIHSSAVFAQNSVKLMSWNIEWLASQSGSTPIQAKRTENDYQKLAEYFSTTQPDILAFQEINDIKAIQKVVGSDYAIILSDRADQSFRSNQFNGINQYTGFAVNKAFTVSNRKDLILDSRPSSKLRFASYLVVETESNQTLHLLSVHLKAGCSGRFKSSNNCHILKKQGEELNDWIRKMDKQNQNYMVLGDFNHNLSYPKDWLWEILVKGSRSKLATYHTKAECKVRSRKNPNKTHQFRSLIDHIIVSPSIETNKPVQTVFTSHDVLTHKLSDHCPLNIEISLP
ncbi:endonuclease/exonuclease/phosphatase family protein [Vibrio sonorensis]|uniref:endonuclease/exonuclease/phosphatase family protein n=1 Tax=Vibrio sonorensis TaxID=1004316 RepID=UPI0008D9B304